MTYQAPCMARPSRLQVPKQCKGLAMLDTTTLAVLAAYKERTGITSDYAAAKRLGVTPSTIANWRNGRSHAQADLAAKMAEASGLDVLGVLASIEADRATSEAVRRVWRQFGKAAFLACWAVCVGIPQAVQSSPNLGGIEGNANDVSAHSALSQIMRLIHAVRAVLGNARMAFRPRPMRAA